MLGLLLDAAVIIGLVYLFNDGEVPGWGTAIATALALGLGFLACAYLLSDALGLFSLVPMGIVAGLLLWIAWALLNNSCGFCVDSFVRRFFSGPTEHIMAASSKAKKKSYRVSNWREYNAALVNRGDITFWFSEDVIEAWEHDNAEVRRGRPFTYSDLAIETLLTVRELFRLPYRQTEGLGRALAKLMGADVPIPHHTSLVKRAAKLDVTMAFAPVSGAVDVVVDSTGLKVYGEGEWKVRQHGVDKRRDWRKIHLAVDPNSHAILAQLTTDSRTHDATAALPLLEQIDAQLQTFYGDGAYNNQKVYDALERRSACALIPPRKDAKISTRPNASWDRNEAIRQIDRHGRKAWKQRSGYHRRSLGETGMSRIKGVFGERLKSREPPQQRTEVSIRCKLLNWFVALGMPLSMMF